MLKYLIILLLILPGASAEAQTKLLQGRVAKQEVALLPQRPMAEETDSLDWYNWRKRVVDEIYDRTENLIQQYRYPVAGELEIHYTVYKEGRIDIEILNDKSTNLGILIPNVIDSIQYSRFLKFPPASLRNKVEFQSTFEIASVAQREYIQQDIEKIYKRCSSQ